MAIDKKVFKQNAVYKIYFQFRDTLFRRQASKLAIETRLPFIKEVIPESGIGAELGVLKGEFSKILWENTKPKKLHLIDPFYFLDAKWDWTDGDKSSVSAVIHILKHFQKEIESKHIVLHVDDDLKVLKSFPDHYLDWVYLDSSHMYEHTVEELKILKDKIKPNGVIAGDDWRPDPAHRHHGVYKAVQEFLEREHYELIYSNEENLQWAIKRIRP